MSRQTVTDLAYHRNGICGLGFHVALVDDKENGRMLVVRFPASADKETGNVVCAAFNLELLAQGDIGFGSNSWRGDHYYLAVDEAIEAAHRQRENTQS